MYPGSSKPSEAPSVAMEVIDLTSDTEASLPPGGEAAASSSLSNRSAETSFPSDINMLKRKKNSKGVKRAADAQQSVFFFFTTQPSNDEEIPGRPGKRRKGSPSSQQGGVDEGINVVRIEGTLKLPHNRFECTQHKFEGPAGSSSHKQKCSLCYCYVCDRPANECPEWTNHCHALDSGPLKSMWKSMRKHAKRSLQSGTRPPVSGRYSAGGSVSWPTIYSRMERLLGRPIRPSPAGLSQQAAAAVAPRTAAAAAAAVPKTAAEAAEEAAMQLVRNTVHPRPKICGGRWLR